MASVNQPVTSSLPADRHFSITPNDSTDLTVTPRAIYVGGAGTLTMLDQNGGSVQYTVLAGQVLPFRATRVTATGTTATGLIGWY